MILLSIRSLLVMAAIFCGLLYVCAQSHGRETHDYAYFRAHPEYRQRVMAWCRQSTQNAATFECKNALHVEAYPNGR
jgi:hypothetical protein